jgi:SAM-dependent methyltransferase
MANYVCSACGRILGIEGLNDKDVILFCPVCRSPRDFRLAPPLTPNIAQLEKRAIEKGFIKTATPTTPERVLFVGAIDGKVELEFLARMTAGECEVYITSYLKSQDLQNLAKKYAANKDTIKHTIKVAENVDATKLSETYPKMKFDKIAWLGPTNDDDKKQTAALVQRFVSSAAQVLKPSGVVYVLQDLRTPNFRGIVKIPGAYFLCEVSLENRTQTQTAASSSKKVMEGRKDHLFGFQFDESAQPKDVNNENNRNFEEILTKIMSSPANQWQPGRHTKKQIADLIFEYANS